MKMMINNQINKTIEKRKKDVVDFTKALISIPTQNPPGENYGKIVELIKKELTSDFETTIYSKNNKPNLVARWNVGAKKTLHINGHYDVVPATPNWKHDPFAPVVKDNKLLGRGSQDMKSGLATMVYAVKVLKECNMKPACNIELSFTCDEESGGIDGAGFLIKNKLVKPDYALVLDGVNQITNAHKGVLALEVIVVGKSAHAAWPSKGVNAFTGACKLAEELDKLNDKLSKTKTRYDTEDELIKVPTIVLGGVTRGGNKFNTIPGEFSFTIDRRILPEEKINDAKKQIMNVINKFEKNNPKYKVKTKILLEAKPAGVNKNVRIAKVFSDAVKEVKGKAPSFTLISGFLDMRFFVNDAKIDCIAYCTRGENLHGDDEFVYVDSIFENIKILIHTMLNSELNKPK